MDTPSHSFLSGHQVRNVIYALLSMSTRDFRPRLGTQGIKRLSDLKSSPKLTFLSLTFMPPKIKPPAMGDHDGESASVPSSQVRSTAPCSSPIRSRWDLFVASQGTSVRLPGSLQEKARITLDGGLPPELLLMSLTGPATAAANPEDKEGGNSRPEGESLLLLSKNTNPHDEHSLNESYNRTVWQKEMFKTLQDLAVFSLDPKLEKWILDCKKSGGLMTNTDLSRTTCRVLDEPHVKEEIGYEMMEKCQALLSDHGDTLTQNPFLSLNAAEGEYFKQEFLNRTAGENSSQESIGPMTMAELQKESLSKTRPVRHVPQRECFGYSDFSFCFGTHSAQEASKNSSELLTVNTADLYSKFTMNVCEGRTTIEMLEEMIMMVRSHPSVLNINGNLSAFPRGLLLFTSYNDHKHLRGKKVMPITLKEL